MFIRTALSLALVVTNHLLAGQSAILLRPDCQGFWLGINPPPPEPGPRDQTKPASYYHDYREAHEWCKQHWCEIVASLVPTPEVLLNSKTGLKQLTVLRCSAWEGATYQLAVCEFEDGKLEVEAWELPFWLALKYDLYEIRYSNPGYGPSEVAKAIPSLYSSKLIPASAKKSVHQLLADFTNINPSGRPNLDDPRYWVQIVSPSGKEQIKTFSSNQDQALSDRIFQLFKSVASKRLTLRSSRTPPALPSALSQHFAISAPLIASVQARPLSFFR